MTLATSLLVLLLIYLAGQYVNKLTKGWISAVLVVVICMLAGFLTGILPADIVETSKLTHVYSIVNVVIIVNVGTMIEPRKFKEYWRVVVSCIAGLAGLTIVVLGLGGLFFGSETALAVYPTLCGSLQATRLMTDALSSIGATSLIGIVTIVQSAQGWLGIPMITLGTKMACKKELAAFRSGDYTAAAAAGTKAEGKKKLIDRLPKRWSTPFLHLTTLTLLAVLANFIAKYTAPVTMNIVGSTIVGLILGCVFRQLGLICKNPLVTTGLMDFALFATIYGIYSRLSTLSGETLLAGLLPIVVFVLLGAVGLSAGSVLVGKLLKVPAGISIAAGFGAYQGFPVNYQVALDTINTEGNTDEERKFLSDKILDNVVMGSVTSVTVLSLVIVSVVIGLFFS